MIDFIFWAIIAIVIFAIGTEDRMIDKKIDYNDLNIGDILDIKGEQYLIKEYSKDGIIVVTDKTGNLYTFSVTDEIKFIVQQQHTSGRHVLVKGFKGTLGSNYLNKIKLV